MIEFKDVSKVYDNGTVALKNVNLTIEKGEFVFIVGSSGAGKSTVLKLMMREEVPSKGSIIIDGVELNKLKDKKIPYLRRKLGIVFQDFRLIPDMTVFDNVAFAMRVIGTKEKVIRKRVPYVLSLVGLPDKARSLPNQLSGGEQQRVALARALANEADIILADEPTGNVDPRMSHEIIELLMDLNSNGTTVIVVTHEHDLVREFDRRIIALREGEVFSDGGPLISEIATSHINSAAELASNPGEATESAADFEDVFSSAAAQEIKEAAAAHDSEEEQPAGPEEPEDNAEPAGPEEPEDNAEPAGPEEPEDNGEPAGPEKPEDNDEPAGPEDDAGEDEKPEGNGGEQQ